MQDPRNLSWLQFNQSRRFPLLAGCTAVSKDGNFAIPDDLLTGLYLSYGLGSGFTDPGGFYLGEIAYWVSGISFVICYRNQDDPDTPVKVAETAVNLEAGQTTAALSGHHNRFFQGTLVLGGTAGLETCPAGEWTFDYEATVLDPFCIRPAASEVSALYVQNGSRISGPFYGNVTLSAGERIDLEVRSAEDALNCLSEPPADGGTEVVISAVPQDLSGNFVRTLRSVPPDETGNIQLIGRACLEIEPRPSQSTLILRDTCSEPCCTCKELEPTQEKIRELDTSILELESRISFLQVQAQLLTQSLAAS
jgi:hypothetical protein